MSLCVGRVGALVFCGPSISRRSMVASIRQLSSEKKELGATEPALPATTPSPRDDEKTQEPPPSPPPRPRTRAQKIRTRLILGTLGAFVATLYYEFGYARRLATFRDTVALVKDVPEIVSVTGELDAFKWYDPRGFVVAWEWRPRIWWR